MITEKIVAVVKLVSPSALATEEIARRISTQGNNVKPQAVWNVLETLFQKGQVTKTVACDVFYWRWVGATNIESVAVSCLGCGDEFWIEDVALPADNTKQGLPYRYRTVRECNKCRKDKNYVQVKSLVDMD